MTTAMAQPRRTDDRRAARLTPEEEAARVAAACRALEREDPTPGLHALARTAELGTFQFHRLFKRITGLTPKAYAVAHRAERVRGELRQGGSVTEALYAAGFGSSGRFYEKSSALLGMTPRCFRAGGPGETIRFAIGQCALGAILVAASARGVCAIFLGDDPDALARDLQGRFPRAELVAGDRDFDRTVALAVGLVEAPGARHELPLDIRGTAFQQRVWQALRAIPAGRTATYAEIAQAIGAPQAVRAVASACAGNKIAIAIPCHRVIRTGGGLSGYRWGVERKEALLAREAAASPNAKRGRVPPR